MSIFNKKPRLVPFTEMATHDFSHALEQEAAEWEQVLWWDFSRTAEAFRYMAGTGVLPGIAIMAGNRCEGYAYYLFRDTRCLVGIYVTPQLRDTEWPRRLLELLLRHPAFTPLPHSVEGQLIFPGVSIDLGDFLVKQGFHFVERCFMRMGTTVPVPEVKIPPDVKLGPFQRLDQDALAGALYLSYRDHVDTQISTLYSSLDGSMRLVEQVFFQDGCGKVEPACSFMATFKGAIAGVVVVSRISARSFYIPQIFVHPQCQALGIGRCLMAQAVRAIRQQDPAAALALTVTAANHRAYEWYRRVGFEGVSTQYAFLFQARTTAAV